MDTPLNKDGKKATPGVQVNDALLNEAETLIWALLDGHIKTEDVKQLESLIREHEQVRQRYLTSVQMHTDLQEHFQPKAITDALEGLTKSPVLGSLGDINPSTGNMPRVIE